MQSCYFDYLQRNQMNFSHGPNKGFQVPYSYRVNGKQ